MYKIVNLPFGGYQFKDSPNFGASIMTGTKDKLQEWLNTQIDKQSPNKKNHWQKLEGISDTIELSVIETGQVLQRLGMVGIDWQKI